MKISKGSVFKRKNSPYLHINLSVNSKRHIFPTKTTDIKEAENKLVLLKAGLLDGSIVLDKDETNKVFNYYSDIYLNTRQLKPSTMRLYTIAVNMWDKNFNNRDIQTIKASEIKNCLVGIKHGRYKTLLSVLKQIFDEACLDEVIKVNPCDNIKPPKNYVEEIVPFEQDEMEIIINSSNGWFKNFLATAFYTGARTGELFALKWQNVDFNKKRIYIDSTRGDYSEGTTKTGKGRYVPIFDILISYLKVQKGLTGMKTYVFLTDYGKNLKPSNVRAYLWKPLLKRLHIPYRKMYITRHTFATVLLNSGDFNLNQIASMLGHTNIGMLIKHYNKFIQDENTKVDTTLNPFCNSFCNIDSMSA